MTMTALTSNQVAKDGLPESSGDVVASAFTRLTTLLRLAEGAWALAVYEDAAIQRQVIEQLRLALAPLPVLELSLLSRTPDPLAILHELQAEQPAPVVCFTGVGSAFPNLCGYLDLQRESLAQLPHRLVFWVTEYDRHYLAEHAPNFYSRLSGVFRFPGTTFTARTSASDVQRQSRPTEAIPSLQSRRRLPPFVQSEKERQRRIDHLQRRIHELKSMARPDAQSIGDSWYDLGSLYEDSFPPQWSKAEAAYNEAARSYAQANNVGLQAEAQALAGYAAYRAYNYTIALEHLQQALRSYRLIEDSPGEANTLKAIGDVQRFRGEYDAAMHSYQQALTLFQAVGDRLGEANTLIAIGDVQQFRGEYDAAMHSYQQALTLFQAVGSRLGEANTFAAQGQVALLKDNNIEADRLLAQAVAIYWAIGDRYSVAAKIANYGRTLRRIGKQEQARLYFRQAADLFAEMGWHDDATRCRQDAEEKPKHSWWQRIREVLHV
jgi:tetratricopeptide (TPR) repeat protein